MKTKRLRAQSVQYSGVLWLLCLFGLSLASPVDAQNLNEPQYSKVEVKTRWEKMTPSSFAGIVSHLVRQCRAQAGINPSDALTLQKCTQLEEQVRSDQCSVIYVPSEETIVFDFLQGRKDGESVTLEAVQKDLGRLDRALWCDLGDVHTYWFTGESGVSCNNLGTVLLPPPATAAAPLNPVATVPGPIEKNCRLVKVKEKWEPGITTFVPAAYTHGAFAPSVRGQIKSDKIQNSILVCDN
jgi:hypothetical protein